MNKPKKVKAYSTDNGGVALTDEMEKWYEEVTDAVNWLLDQQKTDAEKLGELILKVNKEFSGWREGDPIDVSVKENAIRISTRIIRPNEKSPGEEELRRGQ